MKYLNRHKDELFSGKKITYRGIIYWANMTTREVYAHSIDKDYSDYLDEYAVQGMITNRAEINTIDDEPELAALFDELEAAKEE